MTEQREQRRISRWWVAAAVVAGLVVLAAVTPSPYAIERPGPVIDAFGTIETDDGEVEVIRIDGADTYPTGGALNVLSVSITGTPEQPADWLSLAGTLFDPTRAVVPLADLFPDGQTGEERTAQNEAMMRDSQLSAAAAALGELGEDVRARVLVEAVVEGGPAEGLLREGDAILTVDGEPVSGVAGLRATVAGHGASRPLVLGIERGGERIDVAATPRSPEDGAPPMLGIVISAEFDFPVEVELELDEIGGPSAGLVFALGIYDTLTPGELTGGLTVSGTGTIDDAGAVGAIGGLTPKIWGAALSGSELMLMPLENCADLPDRLPEGMAIAPVATLGEAVSAVEDAAAGRTPPGVERCTAG